MLATVNGVLCSAQDAKDSAEANDHAVSVAWIPRDTL
jgi:hypothetical protein